MFLPFFGRLARAFAKQGPALAAVVMDPNPLAGGLLIGKVMADVWGEYRAERKQDKLNADILAAAQMTFEEVKLQAQEAAKQATPDPELQETIEKIITLYPASIRTSLRRKEDPTGRTLPDGYAIQDEQDLVKLSPQRLPRFKKGDAPEFLGGWELVDQLGTGGFGEVWLVQNSEDHHLRDAMKFGHGLNDGELALLNEGNVHSRIQSQGHHPGIVALRDRRTKNVAVPWLRYEYVDGGDLTGYILGWQRLSKEARLAAVLEAFGQLCETVGFFHTLQAADGKADPIVHRDLKPSNILYCTRTKRFKIADFGIGAVSSRRHLTDAAKSQGTILASYLRGSHTPLYASPQQKAGSRAIDPRDDVHALGVIAFQMTTGHLDRGADASFVRDLVKNGASTALADLLSLCVQYDPSERPANAAALHEQLKALGTQHQPTAKTEPETVDLEIVEPVKWKAGCPKCQIRFSFQPQQVGKRGKCPKCDVELVLPAGNGEMAALAVIPVARRELQAGDRKEIDLGGGVKMAFAHCPPGTFRMGSPKSEPERQENETQHTVTLTKGFFMGITPVTQAQWKAVMGSNPSHFNGDNLPVEQVSWEDTQEFLDNLKFKTGQVLRLPTEAEWEYAARGGTSGAYYFGASLNGTQANCDGNNPYGTTTKGPYLQKTSPVGSYAAKFPHPWGLCDVIGNVWEWCEDWYDAKYYERSPESDPVCKDGEQTYRVLRGGSWYNLALYCRSAYRIRYVPSLRYYRIGFRLCSPCT